MNEDSAPKPSASQFPKKGRNDSAALPPNPKGALEKSKLDNFLEKYAYHTVFIFVAVGVVALSVSYFLDGEELARNVYYYFIFIGAGLATILATWRGRQSEEQIRQSNKQISQSNKQISQSNKQIRQSDKQIEQFERQLENSRFEKAVEMATDQKSIARRAVGFRILQQMFTTWRKDFDDTTKKNIEILDYLVLNNFKRTDKQEETFRKLYKDSKISFGADEATISNNLFNEAQKSSINPMALVLWIGIVNWNMRLWDNLDYLAVPGIYATETTPNRSHRFIFSGMDLRNLQFFVENHKGEIIPSIQGTPSTQRVMADFKRTCFLAVDMCGAIVDHVDFSGSHFSKINDEIKIKENCKMSCVGTTFNEVNLLECNFRGADFKGASFIGISTFKVFFDKANLTGCNFEGAALGGASFIGTNISDSDFRQADNLEKEQFLQGAYWIKPGRPKFPSKFPHNFADDLPNEPPTADEIREWEREWERERIAKLYS